MCKPLGVMLAAGLLGAGVAVPLFVAPLQLPFAEYPIYPGWGSWPRNGSALLLLIAGAWVTAWVWGGWPSKRVALVVAIAAVQITILMAALGTGVWI